MGRSQYCYFYDTDEQLAKAVDIIIKHNKAGREEDVGEEVENAYIVRLVEKYKSPKYKTKFCLLFSNGGGRTSTFHYFFINGIPLRPYDCSYAIRFEKEPYMCLTCC